MRNRRYHPLEETRMSIYGEIDPHANTSVVVLLHEQDQVISHQRLAHHLPMILE